MHVFDVKYHKELNVKKMITLLFVYATHHTDLPTRNSSEYCSVVQDMHIDTLDENMFQKIGNDLVLDTHKNLHFESCIDSLPPEFNVIINTQGNVNFLGENLFARHISINANYITVTTKASIKAHGGINLNAERAFALYGKIYAQQDIAIKAKTEVLFESFARVISRGDREEALFDLSEVKSSDGAITVSTTQRNISAKGTQISAPKDILFEAYSDIELIAIKAMEKTITPAEIIGKEAYRQFSAESGTKITFRTPSKLKGTAPNLKAPEIEMDCYGGMDIKTLSISSIRTKR